VRETNESAETEAANEFHVQTKNTIPLVFQREKKDASVALTGRAYISSLVIAALRFFIPRCTERKKTR